MHEHLKPDAIANSFPIAFRCYPDLRDPHSTPIKETSKKDTDDGDGPPEPWDFALVALHRGGDEDKKISQGENNRDGIKNPFPAENGKSVVAVLLAHSRLETEKGECNEYYP